MSKTVAQSTALSAIKRFNSSPVLVDPRHVDDLANDFIQMSRCDNDEYMADAEASMRESLCNAYGVGPASPQKPFAFADGTAIIPVHGTLINRYGGYYFGYVTGYNFIRRQRMQAEMDDDVQRIIYDVNSYGGQASGCFELADELFALRGGKPSIAVVDSNCYSAAYALASSADQIVVTPSGGAGSIGVVAVHMDASKLLEDAGLKVTLIKAGAHKADGNPYEPLREDVRKEMQADVDQAYDMFVALVARNRGLDEKAVRDTEARCYSAQDALAHGLIDAVATPMKAVTEFINGSSDPEDDEPNEDSNMAAATKPANNATETPAQTSAVDTTALNTARTEGANAERERISAIMNCEAAKDRPKMASHLAFNTSMTVNEAEAMLNVAGIETKAAEPVNRADQQNPADPQTSVNPQNNQNFLNAMDKGEHPNVGANGDVNASGDEGDLEANLKSVGFTYN